MSGSYLAFAQAQLIDRFGTGAGYNEFLRRRGMSLGLFTLPVGAVDRQHPHMADEVYIVLEGKGTLEGRRREGAGRGRQHRLGRPRRGAPFR